MNSSFRQLFENQRRLNALLDVDFKDPAMSRRILTALITEYGELLQAAKGEWAWWGRGGFRESDVRAELTDTLFFTLTLLDAADQRGVAVGIPELLSEFDAQIRSIEEEMRRNTPEEGYAVDFPFAAAVEANLALLMRDGIQGVVNSLFVYGMADWMLGDETAPYMGLRVETDWLAKALVNIERWVLAGQVVEEDAWELHREFSDRLDNLTAEAGVA